MTIGLGEDHPSFVEFEGGPDLTEQGRWDRFVMSALHMYQCYGVAALVLMLWAALNPVRQDPRLRYGEDGRPLLPEFDNTWSGAHLASTLEAYFIAWWRTSLLA